MDIHDIFNPVNYFNSGDLTFLRFEFVKFIFDNNLILDTSPGGLLIGPSHKEDGIQVIDIVGDEFCWFAEFEGWEYIVNPFGSTEYHNELETINLLTEELPNFFETYEIPEGIKTIDCRPVIIQNARFTKWLIKGNLPQWIINRESSKKYLQRLNEINEVSWAEAMGT